MGVGMGLGGNGNGETVCKISIIMYLGATQDIKFCYCRHGDN